ncbi:MAG: flagellar biosynthetic protein FliR [Phycisphaeraceae bacterium]|nr:flagellar biosynthetic protein FliR [Phycisphaeraceae bacterium]
MNDLRSILDHTVPFLLVLFRLSGLFVFAPVLSGTIVPSKVRVLMCVMLAAGMYPAVSHEPADWSGVDALSLGWIVAGETLIGLAIGLVAALPIYAAQLGGLIMGQQMGMGLANVYNPALDVEGDTVGQLLLFMAMTVFIALGGLEVLFLAVAGSFASIPAGFALTGGSNDVGSLSAGWLDLLVGVLGSGMDLAVRVAAPVLCIIMLETVAMGFVMKTMPQLNVLTIGFAVKVLIALLGLVLALKAIEQSMHEEIVQVMRAVIRVFGGAGG